MTRRVAAMCCVAWLVIAGLSPTQARSQDATPPSPLDADAEWSEMAPLAEHSLLLDVTLAGERLIAVGERGHVLVSDDRGESWRQVRVPTTRIPTAAHSRPTSSPMPPAPMTQQVLPARISG